MVGLGTYTFPIYVNDLESNFLSKVTIFAVDTKIGCKVENCDKIQKYLNKLINWSDK